ncbi:MAG: PilZ domain-containing protein [Deltaproteobacteria bacterium]|nr:MAG: PilZ domain-containing protein [Deltaproteobacteria bacterium]
MRERREHGRFELQLSGTIEVLASNGNGTFSCSTNDISAGGSYIHTDHPVEEGTRVRLHLTVQSERLRELTGAHGLIKVEGIVVRCAPAGMAICFGENCQIVNLT